MRIKIPATSANLGPGFDSLGLSLDLFNEVNISPQNITSISIKGEGEDRVNIKKNNTFVKIFNENFKSLTDAKDTFKFVFINKIPFSRGLGSSSSVIVGAISSAYHMAGFKVDKELVLNKALIYESHPDNISPAVYGGFTANIVKKDIVFTQKADISDEIKAVVVIPDKPMSTNESRSKLPKKLFLKDSVSNLSHSSFLTACFINKDYANLRLGAYDRIHEYARMKSLPELFKVREIAYQSGALMSTLSGSGSSFLNIAYRDDAHNLAQILSDKFPNFRVLELEFDNNGFKISAES
ncbi:MAG: homoserine kinase [Campylobacter sp.]|nr:homoserine kinase [Campylobacter sp.]